MGQGEPSRSRLSTAGTWPAEDCGGGEESSLGDIRRELRRLSTRSLGSQREGGILSRGEASHGCEGVDWPGAPQKPMQLGLGG